MSWAPGCPAVPPWGCEDHLLSPARTAARGYPDYSVDVSVTCTILVFSSRSQKEFLQCFFFLLFHICSRFCSCVPFIRLRKFPFILSLQNTFIKMISHWILSNTFYLFIVIIWFVTCKSQYNKSHWLKKNYFLLGYSWLAVLWYFQVNSQGTQPYTYMYPFSPKLPSHPGCHITLSRVPCAIYILVFHFKCSSVLQFFFEITPRLFIKINPRTFVHELEVMVYTFPNCLSAELLNYLLVCKYRCLLGD